MSPLSRKSLIAAALSLFLYQFATWPECHATEFSKTVQQPDPEPSMPPINELPAALQSLGFKSEALSTYAFLVDKKRRTLSVWESGPGLPRLMGAWPVDLGGRDGDKVFQGDLRTPEGIYFFQTTRDGRRLNFSKYGARIFTTDYPNPIDRAHHKTGHGIWLHAVPDSTPLTRGSHGCVVVRNYVAEGLARFIELKRTPVIIVDQTDYVPPARWVMLRSDPWLWLKNHLDHQGVKAPDVDDVQIFQQSRHYVFRWRQDFGMKTVYAQKNADQYELVGESWDSWPGQEASRQAQLTKLEN